MIEQSSFQPNYVRELLLVPRRSDTTTSSSLSTTISTCWNNLRKCLQSNDSLAQELYDGLIEEKVSASKIRQYSPEVINHLTQKYTQTPKIAPQVRTFISHIAKTALGQTIALNDPIATQTALWKLYATVTIPALAARPIIMYTPPEEKIREIITCVSENFRSVFPGTSPTELFTLLASWPEELQPDIVIAYSRSKHKTTFMKIIQALNDLKPEQLTFAKKADTLAYIAERFPDCFTPSQITEHLLHTNSSAIECLSDLPAETRRARITALLEASSKAGYLPRIDTCSCLIADYISEDTSQEQLCKLLSYLSEFNKPLPDYIAFFPPRSRIQILIRCLEEPLFLLFQGGWDNEAIVYTTHCLEHFEEDRKRALRLATLAVRSLFPTQALAKSVLHVLQLDEKDYARIKQKAEGIHSSYVSPSSEKIELIFALSQHEEKEIDRVIELIRPLLISSNGKAYVPCVARLITTLIQTAHDQRATLIQAFIIAADSYGSNYEAIPYLLADLKEHQEMSSTTFIEAIRFVSEINKKATPVLPSWRFSPLARAWSFFIMGMNDSVKQQADTLRSFCKRHCQSNHLAPILAELGWLFPPDKRIQALQNLNPDTDLNALGAKNFISNCIIDHTLIAQDELFNFWSKQLESTLHNEHATRGFVNLIFEYQRALDLPFEHPLFQRAIEIVVLIDPNARENRRNPYTLFKELQQQRTVIPAVVLAYKKIEVGTTVFRIDLQGIRDHAATKSSYCFSDLPKSLAKSLANGLGPDFLDKLFQSLDARLDRLSAEKKQMTHAYICEQFRLPYEQLKPHLLQKPLIRRLLALALEPEDPIEQVHFELFSILDVLCRRQNSLNDNILSEQEECLLSIACQLQTCSTGQRDGIQFIYNNLVSTGEITATLHSDSDFEHDFKTLLHQIVQNELNHILTSSHLLSELIGENDNAQLSHQTLYLKNRLHKQLGLRHSLTFDPGSMMISPALVDIDEIHATNAIVAKIDIQKIMRRAEECFKTMMTTDERRKAVYNSVYALFERMPNKPEGWQNWLLFDDTYEFKGLSDEGLARLLEQMGIIKGIDSKKFA